MNYIKNDHFGQLRYAYQRWLEKWNGDRVVWMHENNGGIKRVQIVEIALVEEADLIIRRPEGKQFFVLFFSKSVFKS